jgi:CheY-like chemotaxis protein
MSIKDIVEILLVEDNPRDAELTMRALKKRNLLNVVHWVEDGADALDFLAGQGKYTRHPGSPFLKLVLLDLKLPKVNGLEVLKEIKTNPATKNIPVVILTSSREDPDIKAAYALGANSYVVKPVDFDGFLEAINYTGLYWMLVNRPPN